jgi:threonyl-tRNA synthetase
MGKVPYALVLGERETAQGQVAPRKRGGEQLDAMGLDEFVLLLREEVSNR